MSGLPSGYRNRPPSAGQYVFNRIKTGDFDKRDSSVRLWNQHRNAKFYYNLLTYRRLVRLPRFKYKNRKEEAEKIGSY